MDSDPMNLADLDDSGAQELVAQWLKQLTQERENIERSERRAAGLRKLIDGLVEMFPAAEDVLPEALDEDEEPRPRGAEAIRRLLSDEEFQGRWFTVQTIVNMLNLRGWEPQSSKPANAVRTALERLLESESVEKSRSVRGEVIYRVPSPHPPPPAPPTYDYGDEPF